MRCNRCRRRLIQWRQWHRSGCPNYCRSRSGAAYGGVLLAAVLARFDDAKLVVAATIFGAVLPKLIAWFVVAPLKGQPAAAGFAMPGLLWFRHHRAGSATQRP